MVNAELAKLSPNGEKIIRLRFGLGCNEPAAEMGGEPWTIEQCAQRFEMGEFWVRQTEAKALRQLRNPERSHHLRFWIESAEATALRWLGEQTTPKLPTPAIIIAGQVTPEVAALVEKLNKSIEDINEMSVRSYNCLKNSGIQTIRELAEKTEDEMLQIKNFGRRNLDEMRGILASMDLMFGMRFTE
jgi:hypothetical protein